MKLFASNLAAAIGLLVTSDTKLIPLSYFMSHMSMWIPTMGRIM